MRRVQKMQNLGEGAETTVQKMTDLQKERVGRIAQKMFDRLKEGRARTVKKMFDRRKEGGARTVKKMFDSKEEGGKTVLKIKKLKGEVAMKVQKKHSRKEECLTRVLIMPDPRGEQMKKVRGVIGHHEEVVDRRVQKLREHSEMHTGQIDTMTGILKKTVKGEGTEKTGIVDVKIEKIVMMKETLKNTVTEEERGRKISMKRRIMTGHPKEDQEEKTNVMEGMKIALMKMLMKDVKLKRKATGVLGEKGIKEKMGTWTEVWREKERGVEIGRAVEKGVEIGSALLIGVEIGIQVLQLDKVEKGKRGKIQEMIGTNKTENRKGIGDMKIRIERNTATARIDQEGVLKKMMEKKKCCEEETEKSVEMAEAEKRTEDQKGERNMKKTGVR